ncbi:MarR family winged helix-turn-helix transcriptional regulator [Caldivirga maquilingensis]|uniref:Transcriptional regulator, MarR family n=1 Tax=Caldivirga maquilingensis (strain ATCC 700844 / DSM 13496 / JCM 10307 / IC-167) TaxID=397948 RepID=A8MA53_CALMQ|nr:MarR family winged helix-turn-helix transcriptional regulator [Caldivirga maquilingensis]ABW00985.1 transcriptional regulator, MarR family [Caldivirga maquilingensis IC-167]
MSNQQNNDEIGPVEVNILLTLIRLNGKCLQKDLWKMAGTNSKVGIPALNKLIRMGLVTRRKVNEKVYEIKLTRKGLREARKLEAKASIIPEVDLNLLATIPCFYCPYISSCGVGHENSPETCELLGNWLYNLIKLRSTLGQENAT